MCIESRKVDVMVSAAMPPAVAQTAGFSSILLHRNASGANLALLPKQRMKNAQEKSCREASMSFLVALPALVFLMFVPYQGFSVFPFPPVAPLAAVLLTDPRAPPPAVTA